MFYSHIVPILFSSFYDFAVQLPPHFMTLFWYCDDFILINVLYNYDFILVTYLFFSAWPYFILFIKCIQTEIVLTLYIHY